MPHAAQDHGAIDRKPPLVPRERAMNQTSSFPALGEPGRALAASDVADLTNAVLHEFNNALNCISLHLAVMEQKGAAAEWAPELNGIRREISAAGAKASRLQEICYVGLPTLEPVDLNRLVRRIGDMWQLRDPGLSLHFALAPELPLVRGTSADLEHLLELLIQDAAASLEAGAGFITVSTTRTEQGIELRVTDTGLPPPPEAAGNSLFEPFAPGRKGGDNLRLSLCKMVAKRLQGHIRAETLSDGKVAMIVRLQAA
jgi:signal transduction histidine kinase